MNSSTSLQNDNARTLQTYQDKAQTYVEKTPPINDEIKGWIDASLKYIPKDGTILEVGSGFGRDAEYIQQQGYSIECSDGAPSFVELLQQKGFEARLLNLLTDELGGSYDMVFADAVLLHFTPEEATKVIQKIHAALKDNGIFSFAVKRGDGAVWTEEKLDEPRYFYFWQPEDLKQLLSNQGFEWLEMTESNTAHNNSDWMHIITRKI